MKLIKNQLEKAPIPQIFRDPIFLEVNKDEVKQ